MRINALANTIREDLLGMDGVKRLSVPRRGTILYSLGSPATHVYFVDSGLVKIERTTGANKEVLLAVVASGELFGEQALVPDATFNACAKTLESGVVYSIPSETFQLFCERRPEVWRLLTQHFLNRKDELERKIEHLCHSDVRERLIYYLEELARLNPAPEPSGNVIHISQNEMASLVGATRETTSTTLNSLARQGLISLGHRMVMIPSLDSLREANKLAATAKSTAAGQQHM